MPETGPMALPIVPPDGTIRNRRGQCTASSVMSVQPMAKMGMEHTISGVDAESPMGTNGIGEQLGLRSFSSEVVLEKKV